MFLFYLIRILLDLFFFHDNLQLIRILLDVAFLCFAFPHKVLTNVKSYPSARHARGNESCRTIRYLVCTIRYPNCTIRYPNCTIRYPARFVTPTAQFVTPHDSVPQLHDSLPHEVTNRACRAEGYDPKRQQALGVFIGGCFHRWVFS